ncbi:hypothetical protein [Desulfosporosinus metallidurans]|uniref:Uncharacterized protein n=1 Tax=Desulfosporosinus metallidurans TaxID=1888891 RepID=A0A1Q8QIT1_9FIRM|nr:hypothetical protein [Desulfosporosinus metallidurans]OLN27212.1 hypothetical protein DSOL_4637 [Desulfosporosinus metallidurans]
MDVENQGTEGIKKNIEEFEKLFNEYYMHLLQFIEGIYRKEDNPYYLSHPKLVLDSIRLQASFFKLPDEVQERLLLLDFEVFMHCDNVVDLYSFRDFLLENYRYNRATTIAERVDSELKLVREFIDNDIWGKYHNLPKRKFDFYRQESNVSLLLEMDYYRKTSSVEDKLSSQSELISPNVELIPQTELNIKTANNEEPKDIFGKYNEMVSKGTKSIDSTQDFVSKGIMLFNTITSLFK